MEVHAAADDSNDHRPTTGVPPFRQHDAKDSRVCGAQQKILVLVGSIPYLNLPVPSADITYRTLILNKEQDLICRVWGFYPESIIVSWFLNGSLVESTNTRWINSSAVETVYMFTPTEENQGLELSCEVEHDTLSSPLGVVWGVESIYRNVTGWSPYFAQIGVAKAVYFMSAKTNELTAELCQIGIGEFHRTRKEKGE
uniref:Ig-like domain-containing protein n=1 Tax=Leptobrachium leishanense TaxID=445787 RepID=A0A8C5PTT2_9ANUR